MTRMTREIFKKLKPGDRVYYSGVWVTVARWLEPEYMIEYTQGCNTKISDSWLEDMFVEIKNE